MEHFYIGTTAFLLKWTVNVNVCQHSAVDRIRITPHPCCQFPHLPPLPVSCHFLSLLLEQPVAPPQWMRQHPFQVLKGEPVWDQRVPVSKSGPALLLPRQEGTKEVWVLYCLWSCGKFEAVELPSSLDKGTGTIISRKLDFSFFPDCCISVSFGQSSMSFRSRSFDLK